MFEVAYFMMDTSAMVRRLARLDKTFLFGEPFAIDCADDAAQEVIDRFVTINRMDRDFPDQIMWLSVLGEIGRAHV